MTPRTLRPASIGLLLAACMSCTQERPSQVSDFQVSDSAGIELVVSRSPLLSGGQAWRVDTEPLLVIGQTDGAEPYLFSFVWDATGIEEGRTAVSDAGDLDVRIFDREGGFQSSFGGPGDGPSEFRTPPWLAFAPPDTVVTWDPGVYRLSRFNLEGELLDQKSLRSTISELPYTLFAQGFNWDLGSDGTLLWLGDVLGGSSEGLNQTERRFVLLREDGESLTDLGAYPAGQTYYVRSNGLRGLSNPFAFQAEGALLTDSQGIALSVRPEWEVRVHNRDGSLRSILRAAIPRTALSNEMLQQEADRLPELSEGLGLTLGQTREAFDRLPKSDSLPAIGDLTSDRDGNLWVGRRTSPEGPVRMYDVFDPDGRWVTSVDIPEGVERVLEIGSDRILASAANELGVQSLRIYQIRK